MVGERETKPRMVGHLLLVAVILLAFRETQVSAFRLVANDEFNENSLETDYTTSFQEEIFFKNPLNGLVTLASLGDDVVLDCKAGGKPTPTFHWLFNGKRIVQDGETELSSTSYYGSKSRGGSLPLFHVGDTQSKLFLDCVTPEDAGEYTCVAVTATQTITSSTLLEIDTSVGMNEITGCNNNRKKGEPARIYMWESSRLEYEGADLHLMCRASGDPAPAITWSDAHGNPITKNSDHYKVLKNGDLAVHNVNWMDDMGMFTCHAKNAYGQDNASSFLYPTLP